MDNLLDPVYSYELPFIQELQETCRAQKDFLIKVSSIGDPSKAFSVFFPVILGLNPAIGIKFLTSTVICEWLNQVLKWLLHGHRPYWWIQIKNITNQGLIQTPITCETGPGNPSGHVMINMVIGLTLVKLIESLVYSNGTEGDPIKLMVKRISWNVLYLWILLMVTSRVFILAHFPHQCILAVILGFLCFKLIFNDQTWIYPIWNSTLEKIFMALFLLLSAIFVYVKADDFIGFDINWSIDLAYTYCQNEEWIYIDTTPLYTMVRYSGSALGLAMSKKLTTTTSQSWKSNLVYVTFGLIIAQGSQFIHQMYLKTRITDILLFYCSEYVLNAVTVSLLISLRNA